MKSEALSAVMHVSLPRVPIDYQEAYIAVRVLAFNWSHGIEQVIAFSVQQMLMTPGIVLSARYTKMNKTEFLPLINSMLGDKKINKLLSDFTVTSVC